MKKLMIAFASLAGALVLASPVLASPSISLDLNPMFPDHLENPGGQLVASCVVNPDGTVPGGIRIQILDPAGDTYGEWDYPGVTEWTLAWTVPDGVPDGIWTYRAEYYSEQRVEADTAQRFLVAGRTSGICAFKFFDPNGNATYDDGEELLPGWEICFSGPDGTECRVTDADGAACIFFLAPGVYEVCETLQPGWESTTGVCTEIVVTSSIEKAMFGNIPVVPTVESGWGKVKAIYR